MSTPDDPTRRTFNNPASDSSGQAPAGQGYSEANEPDYKKDQILAGKYRIVSLLGRGGMGVVYRVEQAFVGAQLALKTIEKSEMSEFTLKRFEAEAKATFAVNHPSIVSVKDYGLLDNQIPFMVMELIDGETIGSFLQHRTFSVSEALDVFIQICFGLAHAHDNGVIHRDIKPSNIMLLNKLAWDTEGSVKIMDFGIAKLTQHDGGEIQALTRTGEIFGSPFYMSPEQCSGEKIDQRTDVYSLGCVLFEALTGKPPFVGESALQTMMMHQGDVVPTLKQASGGKEFSPALESIVQKMLSKKQIDRYSNLGETAYDLGAVKRGDVDNVRAYKIDKSKAKKIKSTRVTLKKTSYAMLLSSVAVVSALTTTFVMRDMLGPKIVAAPPVAPVGAVDSGAEDQNLGALTGANIGKHVFEQDLRSGACRIITKAFANDASLADLSNNADVQYLDLSDSSVTDPGFANLGSIKLLKLIVKNCRNIKAVDNISKLNYLQELNLYGTNISDQDLSKLANMPMLSHLDIDNCKLSESKLLDLAKSKSLQSIALPNHPRISAETISKLQQKMPWCAFGNYTNGPLFEDVVSKTKGLTALQKETKKFEFVQKASPDCDMSTTFMQIIALLTDDQPPGKKKSKQQVQDLVNRLHKAEAILEKNGNLAKLGQMLIVSSNKDIEIGNTQRALADSKKAAQLLTDTVMHDDPILVTQLSQVSWVPVQANKLRDAIAMQKTALKFAEKFPGPDSAATQFANLLESLGWLHHRLSEPAEAAPYFARSNKYFTQHRGEFPSQYARSIIELAYAEPPGPKQSELFTEGLQEIEKLNFRNEYNLREHYCDSCVIIARQFNKAGKRADAMAYLKRGQKAANLIDNDNNTRRNFFANLVQEEAKGHDI